MESMSSQPYNDNSINGVTESERNWAMLIHLSLYSIFILNIFAILVPGTLWFLRKADSRFIDEHGKAALNFFLSLAILGLVLGFGLFFLMFAGVIAVPAVALMNFDAALGAGFGGFVFLFGLIGFFMFISLLILILPLLGVKAATAGKTYRYPLCIPFVS